MSGISKTSPNATAVVRTKDRYSWADRAGMIWSPPSPSRIDRPWGMMMYANTIPMPNITWLSTTNGRAYRRSRVVRPGVMNRHSW